MNDAKLFSIIAGKDYETLSIHTTAHLLWEFWSFQRKTRAFCINSCMKLVLLKKNSNIKLSSVLTCDFSSQKYLDSVFKPDFFLEKVRRKTVVTLPLFIDNKTYSPLIFKIQSKRRQKDINFQ